jgi:DNA-binding CsgD family transcriptional regulator/tetratricopeptide (TPR) repeat protein
MSLIDGVGPTPIRIRPRSAVTVVRDVPEDGPDPGLVGRDAELASLEQILAGRGQGAGVVAVTGDPGVGKTRLLGAMRQAAERAGWRVLYWHAADAPRYRPCDGLRDLIAPILAEIPEIADEPPSASRWPAADGGTSCSPEPLPDGTHSCHIRARALLDRASAVRPLLVILDDLHWADAVIADLVEQLMRSGQPGQLLITLAYRPRQISSRLAAAVERYCAAGLAVRLALGGLSVEHVAELLGPQLSTRLIERLHRQSAGNPLYLGALVSASGIAGVPAHYRSAFDQAAAVLRADVEAAGPESRTVAHAATVLGDSFEAGLLPEVADVPAEQFRPGLDELLRRDVLRMDQASGLLSFRHPLLRRVVYAQIDEAWRTSAHARAAHLYDRRGASPVLQANHLTRSAMPGDVPASETLAKAAQSVRWLTPVRAARWYDHAARLLPETAAFSGRRARILFEQAAIWASTGRLTTGNAALEMASSVLGKDTGRLSHAAARAAAALARSAGRPDEAMNVAQRALATDTDCVDDTRELWLELAATAALNGDFERAGAALDGCELAADDTGNSAAWPGTTALDRLRLTTLALRAFVLLSQSETNATELAARAGSALDCLSDSELASCLPAGLTTGLSDLLVGGNHDALRRFDRTLRVARATGQRDVGVPLLIGRGLALRWLGRLEEARSCLEQATGVTSATHNDCWRTMALTSLCGVLTDLGHLDPAIEVGALGVEEARRSGSSWLIGLAVKALVGARLETGDAAGCVEPLLEAGGGPDLPRVSLAARPAWYEVLTRASVRVGDPQASEWANRAHRTAARTGLAIAFAYAWLAEAWAAQARSARNEPDGETSAAEAANTAAELFDRISSPIEATRARLLAAQYLIDESDETGAAAQLVRQAADDSARCGAAGLSALAAALQRRPVGPDPADSSDVTLLSPREREVARFVAEGRTNREIAGELFISEKTVERHLSRTFTKLGIRSRTELAVRVSQEG